MSNKLRFIVIQLKHIFYGLSNTKYMLNILADEMVGMRLRLSDIELYQKYLKQINEDYSDE